MILRVSSKMRLSASSRPLSPIRKAVMALDDSLAAVASGASVAISCLQAEEARCSLLDYIPPTSRLASPDIDESSCVSSMPRNTGSSGRGT
ncbi:unnamed protein product [Protopolystoma xenopodis]|uniref:Uncharacterized protein n=1 Tax=Protopolystoma xenopodis TaxID=117903 RepID=A0A448WLB8_9PLAT|nr:unnamed protein product [Protopolystoma xenopodis]